MKRYIKNSVIEIGTDKAKMDTPTFGIRNVGINTESNELSLEILHEVMQGSVMNPHSRSITITFANLPAAVKATGIAFLEALDVEMLKNPQYAGATPI